MEASAPATATRPPTLTALFLAFAKIGGLSFGGGSTTLVMMQQETVDRRGWLTAREFILTLGLSQMWPGVHLIAQSVLIGHRLRGLAGGLTCMLGLMLPSTTVTILFTAFFLVLRANPLGEGMIAGVLPATAGLAFAVAFRFGAAEVRGQRRVAGLIVVVLALGTFTLMAFFGVSSVIAVLGAGLAAIVLYRLVGGADEPH